MKALDLAGHKYGLLTVVAYEGATNGPKPERLWSCACDCGNTKIVRQNNLRSGHTQSCGCHMRNQTRKANLKHGMVNTSTYTIWCLMKARCYQPSNISYGNYGAKGITVCDRWKDSFENFLADMGERPSKKHSIDRIDNLKGYSPDNCRWATSSEQNRNYSKNVVIEYKGRSQCLADWADELGIERATLGRRLRAGWSVDHAFNLPVNLGNSPSTRNVS